MYERFYNLRERPFALSPDPEYLYLSRVHREALDSIRYGIESRAGFIVITGAVGAGKTTLLQTILNRLDDRTVVARIVNTTLEPRELLEAIMLEFGIDTTGKSKPVLMRDLGQFLVRQRVEGRRPLLVIDEAQNLGPQALEEVRLLSNLETEKSKLLQILLAGQPNLRDTIASPALEQFRQRIAVSYHLTPLDADETAAYIHSRLAHAAIGTPPRFPREASDLVHSRSGGVPRTINVICDAALVFGYAEERRDIDLSLIREVVAELETTGVLRAQSALEMPAAAAVPEAAGVGAATTPFVQPQATVPVGLQPNVVFPAPGPRPVVHEPTQPKTAAQTAGLHVAAPAVAAPPLQDVSRTFAAIEGRERALAARERELAEQRRILAEECRLLRERRAAVVAAAPVGRAGATAVRTPAAPRTPVGAARGPPRPAAQEFRSPQGEGFRGWVRRMIASFSHRAMHGTRSVHGS